jgi:hypothetical protein
MAARRLLLRFLATFLPLVSVGAPSAALLLDARPAVRAMLERAVGHVE